MNPFIVPTHDVDTLWPQIADGLGKACIRCRADDLNAGVLWQMCRSGQAFLVLACDGSEILQTSVWRFDTPDYPHTFRCVMLAGRDMKCWFGPMQDFITKIAKDNGATQLVTTGRNGWLRLIPNAEKIGTNYEVDI